MLTLLPSLQNITVNAVSASVISNKSTNKNIKDPYISEESLALYVGQSKALSIIGLSTEENYFSGEWNSSDTLVATVAYGRVYAIGPGKANITFKYSKYGNPSKTYTCQITVTHGSVVTKTVPETIESEIEKTPHVVFIMNHNLANAKIAEFYKYLGSTENHSIVDYIYSYSVSTVLKDETAMSKVAEADEIIMIGTQLSNDNFDELKSSGKTNANFHNVTWLDEYNRFLRFSKTTGLNILSSRQVWIDMYYANIADVKQLNFNNSDSKPTLTAGLGLAIYLQYEINNNSCINTSYSDLESYMTAETLSEIGEELYEKTKKLLTNESTSIFNESGPILHLTEENKPDLINQYKQNHYNIIDDLYNGNHSSGIFSMEQTTDGNPICYETISLDYSKYKGYDVYAWNGTKWKIQKSYPLEEHALRVLTWSNGKWNTKVYRYTDDGKKENPLKTDLAFGIRRDSDGNSYMAINKNDKYYIFQLDKYLKVKYKVCVSDLIESQFAGFHLLMNGKILLETFDSADTTSNEAYWNNEFRLYNNLQLVNLKSGKITREYDTSYYPYGYIKVKGKYIYMRDKSLENIVVIDSYSGRLVKVIHLADLDYLIKPHEYSSDLGSQYDYDFAISGKYIYILKKTGIYRIDKENGNCLKIMDNSYKPFGIQDMRFVDFEVKNSETLYIFSVYFDAECASNFYIYTK